MAERDTRFDLLALGLLVVVAFLGTSLVTYDAADPQVELVYPLNQLVEADVLTYPLNETPQNACGPWGALAAAVLFRGLGLGAYYAVASLGVLTVLMLLRRDISSPLLRTLGWVISLVGFTTIAAMLLNYASPGSIYGAGGSLGALFSAIFRVHFATVGGFLLSLSLFVGGLLLCTDYVLIHAGLFLASLTMAGLMGIRSESARSAVPQSRRAKANDSLENEIAEEESDIVEDDDEIVSIRVRGKHVVSTDGDDDVLEEEIHDGDEELDRDVDDEADDEDSFDEDHDHSELEEAEEQDATAQHESGFTSVAHPSPQIAARRGRRRLAALRVRRPPEPEDRDAVMHQLDEAAEREDQIDYDLPSIELLTQSDDFCYDKQTTEVRQKAKVLEKTFTSFGYNVKVVEIETGPVIAQYEVELESGLRLSRITGLADDLAIALRVPSVRIVAPIPGKNTVGIEVPNDERQLVRLREVMEESLSKTKKMRIPIFLGKDVSGNPLTVDLATMPHLLIAGRTGTGKSVCLNAIITSILMTRKPDEVRMLMIDPKMVELSGYKSLPHLMHPVVTDMRKAEAILAWAVDKMEERYSLLAQAGVRHLAGYNQLGREELLNRIQPETDELAAAIPTHMPYIVIVADEIADMMMTAGKEVEQHIIRLAQKSRAVGIHLILATQKPTVDVITGLIKSNLPARVAFQVASRVDSRVVLDEMGADRLLGNGDMLFLYPGTSQLLRGQGTFVSDEEINSVVAAVSTGEQDFVTELVQMELPDPESAHSPASLKKRDELYEKAIEIVVTEGRGSVSLLQRALGIGYGRAARLIDFMAEDGIVGTYAGSQAREVLMSMADIRRMQEGAAQKPATSKPPRTIRLAQTSNKLHRVSAQNDQDDLPDDDEADAESLALENEQYVDGDDISSDVGPHLIEDDLADCEDEYDEAENADLDDDEFEYVYEYVEVDEDEDESEHDADVDYEYDDIEESVVDIDNADIVDELDDDPEDDPEDEDVPHDSMEDDDAEDVENEDENEALIDEADGRESVEMVKHSAHHHIDDPRRRKPVSDDLRRQGQLRT